MKHRLPSALTYCPLGIRFLCLVASILTVCSALDARYYWGSFLETDRNCFDIHVYYPFFLRVDSHPGTGAECHPFVENDIEALKEAVASDLERENPSSMEDLYEVAEAWVSHTQELLNAGAYTAKRQPVTAFQQVVPVSYRYYLKGAWFMAMSDLHGYRVFLYDAISNDPYSRTAEAERYLNLARKEWRKLLDLPEDKRRFLSTWAAYRLGLTWMTENPAEARRWFARTRELAQQGFDDVQGLAHASLGADASLDIYENKPGKAVRAYIGQYQCGNSNALDSLRFVVSDCIVKSQSKPEMLEKAFEDEAFVCAAVNSGLEEPGARITRKQISLLLTPEQARKVGLPYVAAVAYKHYLETLQESFNRYSGDDTKMDEALAEALKALKKWLSMSDPENPLTCLVNTHLLMMDGDYREALELAEKTLVKVSQATPEHTGTSTAYTGCLSVCCSSIDQQLMNLRSLALYRLERYYDAFIACMSYAGYSSVSWEIAPEWMAEAVLTPEELERALSYIVDGETRQQMEYILARRLFRLEAYDRALVYMPEKYQSLAREFLDCLDAGYHSEISSAEKAEALWRAARILRWRGMELMGTEYAPDGADMHGQYEMMHFRLENRDSFEFFPPLDSEQQRIIAHKAVPDKRWHYRYNAIEIAMDALAEMSASEETFLRYNKAASWLASRNPEAVNPLYLQMLIHFKGTEQEQRINGWFPCFYGADADDFPADTRR